MKKSVKVKRRKVKILDYIKPGDLVRWLEDGNLEFIGRKDDQVKNRGFRIELGEIETQLSQHPDINQCVVVAHEEAGQKTLVGYYVAKQGTEGIITSEVLRKYLAQQLPDYMLPSIFVELQDLPLTPNGKVNKKALPKPDSSNINTGNEECSTTNRRRKDISRDLERYS